MPFRIPRFPPPHWSSEQRSALVFAVLLGLALLAVTFPEMPPQALQGILWSGAGLLMLLFPPATRLPWIWWLLAAGFVLFSMAGFLPRGGNAPPAWRADLERLGLETGNLGIVQPLVAAEVMAGFAVTALVVLFMLGHRVGSRAQQGLAVAFILGVAAWVVVAMLGHRPEQVFGFFPNRNHTATLVAMGSFAALACLAHGIQRKQAGVILLAVIPLLLFLHVLLGVSESRAGVVLLVAGLLAWIPLAGTRYLRGHVGKAVLLLVFGLAGTFLVMDSRVKERVAASLGGLQSPAEESPGPSAGPAAEGIPADGRIPIYRDTWQMIRAEPWTGVGPGQFVWIFPQYRDRIRLSSETPCLHPESDWLMILAENGWPAAACLVIGVISVLVPAFARARHGRSRGLRTGCAVAAALLCVHGIFDVPGHRVGLAWSAALLLAISLRPGEGGEAGSGSRRHGAGRIGWRLAGSVLLAGGLVLLHAQWTRGAVLPSALAAREMREMQRVYEADRAAAELARQEGRRYQPAPGDDPLDEALEHAERAAAIRPLDPHPHYIRGVLALHFEGKETEAGQSFAIQRRLFPQQVTVVMNQAQAWGVRDLARVRELWTEALERAAADEARFSWSQVRVGNTYERILREAAEDERLSALALDLAAGDFHRLEMWVRATPAAALDLHFPRISGAGLTADQRQALLRIWKNRGSKEAIGAFEREHPEFLVPSG